MNERVARAAALLREQSEQRRKRIEMFLQRGRNQLGTAESVAKTVRTEPAPAIEAYRQAKESYENVLQDDAGNAEALEAGRTIEERLRALALHVDRARIEEAEIGSSLEAARAAVAEAEVAGGSRASDLDSILAVLHEADTALDRVLAIAPKNDDAIPLHTQVALLRKAVLDEQDRRAEREEQARREKEAAGRKAEEDARRAENERREKEAAELKAQEEAKRAEEAKRRRAEEEARKETEPKAPVTQPVAAADSKKLDEFEKGLQKHQRLFKQGRTREAAEIQKILKAEAGSIPELVERYSAAFPEPTPKPRRGLFIGIAAGILVAAAAAWLIVGQSTPQQLVEVVGITPTPGPHTPRPHRGPHPDPRRDPHLHPRTPQRPTPDPRRDPHLHHTHTEAHTYTRTHTEAHTRTHTPAPTPGPTRAPTPCYRSLSPAGSGPASSQRQAEPWDPAFTSTSPPLAAAR